MKVKEGCIQPGEKAGWKAVPGWLGLGGKCWERKSQSTHAPCLVGGDISQCSYTALDVNMFPLLTICQKAFLISQIFFCEFNIQFSPSMSISKYVHK